MRNVAERIVDTHIAWIQATEEESPNEAQTYADFCAAIADARDTLAAIPPGGPCCAQCMLFGRAVQIVLRADERLDHPVDEDLALEALDDAVEALALMLDVRDVAARAVEAAEAPALQ